MLTNNGKVLFVVGFSAGSTSLRQRVFKNTSGTETLKSIDGSIFTGTDALRVVVGKGTTLPTKEDYCLESPILNLDTLNVSHSKSSYASNISADEPTDLLYATTVFSNNTSEDITITELGIELLLSGTTYTLLTRQLLDTPYTIEVGHSVQFKIALR